MKTRNPARIVFTITPGDEGTEKVEDTYEYAKQNPFWDQMSLLSKAKTLLLLQAAVNHFNNGDLEPGRYETYFVMGGLKARTKRIS